MAISSYSNVQARPGVDLQSGVLGMGAKNKLEVREPLDPPSGWTRFKAALSNLPLLGGLGALKQARAEVEAYPVKLGEYQATNRQLLTGLMKDLRSEFGDEIAEMTLRNMGVEDGAPLSLRTVGTALEGAKRSQQQCKSQNNMLVTRFLESPLQGGARLRGEQDMNDVFLERGLKLGDAPGWQGAIGPGAEKFITKYVQARCQELPEHAKGRLTNEQIVAAANEAFALYEELSAVPGMTHERLGAILEQATEKSSVRELAGKAREEAIMDKVDPMLNRRDPGSFLSTEAGKVARGHGLPPLPDAVLKSIGNNMGEMLRYGANQLSKELGCAPDTTSVIAALRPRLEENVHKALDEHCQALKMIEGSTTLNDAQKAKLREIAATRRMDPVQVAEYEKVAATMSEALKAAGELPGGAGKLVEAMKGVLRQFEKSMTAMGEHGGTFWESGSLKGGDTTNILNGQFAEVAAAGLTPEQARELDKAMTGDAMKDFMRAVRSSGDMMVEVQLPMMLDGLLLAVGARAGGDPQLVDQRVRDVLGTDPGDPSTLPPGMLEAVKTAAAGWSER
jgi:hypothetical protein